MIKRDTILAAYARGVLTIWRPYEPGWLEIRGKLDECASDPLQIVIDRLSGSLVGGELMAGNIASINWRMYRKDYPILAALHDVRCYFGSASECCMMPFSWQCKHVHGGDP
jgi:hypothetical protein